MLQSQSPSQQLEAVANIDPKQINSLEAVRSFLGLCSYYRRFIRRFTIRAAPLTALTRSGVDVAAESQTPRPAVRPSSKDLKPKLFRHTVI